MSKETLLGLPVVVDERVPTGPPWNGMFFMPPEIDAEELLDYLFGPKEDAPVSSRDVTDHR